MRNTFIGLGALVMSTLVGCDDDPKAKLLAKVEAGASATPATSILPPTAATPSASATAAPTPKKKADCSAVVAANGTIVFDDSNRALEKEIHFKLQKDAGPITKADLQQIRSLNLTRYGKINQLDPCIFPMLTNLKDLFIGEGDVDDLSPIGNLTQMESLRAAINKVTDLTPIEKLTRLDRLDISHTGVTDLKSLQYLPNLTELMIDEDNVTDLGPVANCKKLEQLSIKKTPIKDVSALREIKTLKKLWIEGSGVTDVSPLAPLKNGGLKILTTG